MLPLFLLEDCCQVLLLTHTCFVRSYSREHVVLSRLGLPIQIHWFLASRDIYLEADASASVSILVLSRSQWHTEHWHWHLGRIWQRCRRRKNNGQLRSIDWQENGKILTERKAHKLDGDTRSSPSLSFVSDDTTSSLLAVRRRGSPASYLNTVVDQVVGRAAKARGQTNGAWKRRSAVGRLVVVASVGKTSGLPKTNGSRMTNWARKTNEARKGRRPEMPDDAIRFVSVHDPNRQRRRLDSQSAIEPLKGHWPIPCKCQWVIEISFSFRESRQLFPLFSGG